MVRDEPLFTVHWQLSSPEFPEFLRVYLIHNPYHRMVYRHKFNRHGLGRFPAPNDEYQLSWPGLCRGIGGNDWLPFWLLPFAEGLNYQELNPL